MPSGGRLIEVGLRDHLDRDLALGALEGDLRERRSRLQLMQQRDVIAVAQLQQQLALLHVIA